MLIKSRLVIKTLSGNEQPFLRELESINLTSSQYPGVFNYEANHTS